MFTASLTDATEIESYLTLEDALIDMLHVGWEDSADRLLSSPVLVRDDDDGHVVAIISYTPDPDEPDYPILVIHFTATNALSAYRRHEFRDSHETAAELMATTGFRGSYEARSVALSYLPALVF
jgi:hypothetical protein